jgi:hypothetical protein
MSGPLYASHDQPVSVTVKDFLVQGWVAPAGTPLAAQGPSDAPLWTIQLGDHLYAGPRVDPARHGSLHDVKEMLREWAREHASLFV